MLSSGEHNFVIYNQNKLVGKKGLDLPGDGLAGLAPTPRNQTETPSTYKIPFLKSTFRACVSIVASEKQSLLRGAIDVRAKETTASTSQEEV